MHVLSGLRFCILALGWAACAGGTPRGSDQDTVTAITPGPLRISLDVPREVRAGQPVPIVIRVQNSSPQPLDLYLRGRTIAFDIFITRESGEIVWQRLKDEIIPAIIQLKVLQPGEVLELKDEWRQRDHRREPVKPGTYVVRGAVLTDGPGPLETAPATLHIVPPN